VSQGTIFHEDDKSMLPQPEYIDTMVSYNFKLFRIGEAKRAQLIIRVNPESREYIADRGFGMGVQFESRWTEGVIGHVIGILMKDHVISQDEAEDVFKTAIIVWELPPKTDHD
jgi:hypothetical protein